MGTLTAYVQDLPKSALLSMAPETPTPIPEIVEALRTITPLVGLSDEEYEWLARHGKERIGDGLGTLVFREGEPVSVMTCLLKGEIHVRRRNSGPMALFIGRAGQITGKLPFSRMKGYGGDGYTNGPVWVLDIDESDPFDGAALRFGAAGSGTRGNAHGAAGRKAGGTGQAGGEPGARIE
jgi:hypothetical protein